MKRRALATAALASVLLAGGCGIPENVVGLHPAPTEKASAAVFSATAARQVGNRTLDVAREAMTGNDKDVDARKAALVGPALRLAEVKDKFVPEGQTDAFVVPPTSTVLGVSRGRDWPRYILSPAQEDGDFRRQEVPEDAHRFDAGAGLVASPQKVLDAYSAALAYPTKSRTSSVVNLEDAFAKGILASSADAADALGKLGTFKRTHADFADDTLAFKLADGGVLVFAQFGRRDLLEPTAKAKELVLSSTLAKLAGRSKVTDHVQLDWLETLAIVIPASGKATVVGAGEQLRGIDAK